jgi:hypothetical protein
MKVRLPKAGSVLAALTVAVVVAAAAVVWHNLPTPTDVYGPFDVHAEAGESATGRGVSATVTAVRIAPEVNSVHAAGQWVVIETTMEGVRSTETPHSDLIVGPNTYRPSDRFLGKTLGADVAPDIAQRGAWVFDVASALLAPGAIDSLTLRVWVGDGRLDSRLVIRIPVDDSRVSRTDAVKLSPLEETAA